MKTKDEPLVSIVVLTYNSARYVLETLQSAERQTYHNIELIISDDCSTDGTPVLCREWIKEHGKRFLNAQYIQPEINSGIPANCNRGIKAALGEWIKLIAGDDILHDRCIESLMRYTINWRNVKIVASRSQIFSGTFNAKNFLQTRDLSASKFFDEGTTALQQFMMLLSYNYIDAITTLIHREFILSVGGFEEKFRLIEDLPFWRKITAMGVKIHFCNELTSYYRIHEEGISHSANARSKLRNYMLLDYALCMFDTYNKEFISIEYKTILVRKYFSLLIRPFGNFSNKILQVKKISKYWPGLHNIVLLKPLNIRIVGTKDN